MTSPARGRAANCRRRRVRRLDELVRTAASSGGTAIGSRDAFGKPRPTNIPRDVAWRWAAARAGSPPAHALLARARAGERAMRLSDTSGVSLAARHPSVSWGDGGGLLHCVAGIRVTGPWRALFTRRTSSGWSVTCARMRSVTELAAVRVEEITPVADDRVTRIPVHAMRCPPPRRQLS